MLLHGGENHIRAGTGRKGSIAATTIRMTLLPTNSCNHVERAGGDKAKQEDHPLDRQGGDIIGGGSNTECYAARCLSVSRIICMYPCLLLKRSTICSGAPVKETPALPVFLYAKGIHAQLTSQRGSGAPGKTGSFSPVDVPMYPLVHSYRWKQPDPRCGSLR